METKGKLVEAYYLNRIPKWKVDQMVKKNISQIEQMN